MLLGGGGQRLRDRQRAAPRRDAGLRIRTAAEFYLFDNLSDCSDAATTTGSGAADPAHLAYSTRAFFSSFPNPLVVYAFAMANEHSFSRFLPGIHPSRMV